MCWQEGGTHVVIQEKVSSCAVSTACTSTQSFLSACSALWSTGTTAVSPAYPRWIPTQTHPSCTVDKLTPDGSLYEREWARVEVWKQVRSGRSELIANVWRHASVCIIFTWSQLLPMPLLVTEWHLRTHTDTHTHTETSVSAVWGPIGAPAALCTFDRPRCSTQHSG